MSIKTIVPTWSLPGNVIAYTSTREGGVSTGPFLSGNLGHHVGDDGGDVEKNRASLPYAKSIFWLEQTHSARCIELPCNSNSADAAISRKEGVFCAVMTADCLPILLSNTSGTEVAAIHAGWKGLLNGIITNTLLQMRSKPSDIVAWIGPSIRQKHYQVPVSFAQRFRQWPQAIGHVSAEIVAINLPLVAICQMQQFGLRNVIDSHLCTYGQDELFFSHRRATHEGRHTTGRIASVVGFV